MEKHGMSGTPEYRAWKSMHSRCKAKGPRDGGYKNICVCDEWRESFTAFFKHVGPRPSTKHSLDRIDNTGNYEPGNVRWATPEEQQGNRSVSKRITYKGKTQHLSAWARELGIDKQTLQARLANGWTTEEAFTTPVNTMRSSDKRLLTYKGESKSAADWARSLGMHPVTFATRMFKGWTLEETIEIPVGSRRCRKT